MVMALNNSSASLSWTPPPHNSLNYTMAVVNSVSMLVVSSDITTCNSLIIVPLIVGESYMFRVASMNAAERMITPVGRD